MQRMKHGLQGWLPLTKAAQKNIKGGASAVGSFDGVCTITYTYPNGGSSYTRKATFYGTCAEQSAGANGVCVKMLENENVGGDSCRYDCGCDGWGH